MKKLLNSSTLLVLAFATQTIYAQIRQNTEIELGRNNKDILKAIKNQFGSEKMGKLLDKIPTSNQVKSFIAGKDAKPITRSEFRQAFEQDQASLTRLGRISDQLGPKHGPKFVEKVMERIHADVKVGGGNKGVAQCLDDAIKGEVKGSVTLQERWRTSYDNALVDMVDMARAAAEAEARAKAAAEAESRAKAEAESRAKAEAETEARAAVLRAQAALAWIKATSQLKAADERVKRVISEISFEEVVGANSSKRPYEVITAILDGPLSMLIEELKAVDMDLEQEYLRFREITNLLSANNVPNIAENRYDHDSIIKEFEIKINLLISEVINGINGINSIINETLFKSTSLYTAVSFWLPEELDLLYERMKELEKVLGSGMKHIQVKASINFEKDFFTPIQTANKAIVMGERAMADKWFREYLRLKDKLVSHYYKLDYKNFGIFLGDGQRSNKATLETLSDKASSFERRYLNLYSLDAGERRKREIDNLRKEIINFYGGIRPNNNSNSQASDLGNVVAGAVVGGALFGGLGALAGAAGAADIAASREAANRVHADYFSAVSSWSGVMAIIDGRAGGLSAAERKSYTEWLERLRDRDYSGTARNSDREIKAELQAVLKNARDTSNFIKNEFVPALKRRYD